MKKTVFAFLIAVFITGCLEDTTDPIVMPEPEVEAATILGRWVLVGFEEAVRYEFTENKRFTIYSGDGTFPTLEDLLMESPQLTGLDWEYVGDTVEVDLNFGNYSRLVPNFKCDNAVIDWIAGDGSVQTSYYRESHDITACN